MSLKTLTLIILLALATVCLAHQGHAEGIIYTFSGTANGTFGDRVLSNADFTITALSDVSRTGDYYGIATNTILSATISVSGITNGAFTTQLVAVDYLNPNSSEASVGLFTHLQGMELVGDVNPAFQTYGLASSIGPVIGSSPPNSNFASFATSAGPIDFTSLLNPSFEATLQPVPEPSVSGLVGIGVLLLSALKRHHWKCMA